VGRTKDPKLEEARRAQVLDAAVRLLAAHDRASPSLDEVAREAGVSKGLVTYWFPNKEALVLGAFAECHQYRRAVDFRFGQLIDPEVETARVGFPVQDVVVEQPDEVFSAGIAAIQARKFCAGHECTRNVVQAHALLDLVHPEAGAGRFGRTVERGLVQAIRLAAGTVGIDRQMLGRGLHRRASCAARRELDPAQRGVRGGDQPSLAEAARGDRTVERADPLARSVGRDRHDLTAAIDVRGNAGHEQECLARLAFDAQPGTEVEERVDHRRSQRPPQYD
jgi:AcrR family transcriptional regulator